jgi:hypothetical protein
LSIGNESSAGIVSLSASRPVLDKTSLVEVMVIAIKIVDLGIVT